MGGSAFLVRCSRGISESDNPGPGVAVPSSGSPLCWYRIDLKRFSQLSHISNLLYSIPAASSYRSRHRADLDVQHWSPEESCSSAARGLVEARNIPLLSAGISPKSTEI